jgi:hypothetical protein
MHLGIALTAGVLRRTGRMDNRRVYNGARTDADPLAFQISVDRHQHFAAPIVLFKQMAEAQDRR